MTIYIRIPGKVLTDFLFIISDQILIYSDISTERISSTVLLTSSNEPTYEKPSLISTNLPEPFMLNYPNPFSYENTIANIIPKSEWSSYAKSEYVIL